MQSTVPPTLTEQQQYYYPTMAAHPATLAHPGQTSVHTQQYQQQQGYYEVSSNGEGAQYVLAAPNAEQQTPIYIQNIPTQPPCMIIPSQQLMYQGQPIYPSVYAGQTQPMYHQPQAIYPQIQYAQPPAMYQPQMPQVYYTPEYAANQQHSAAQKESADNRGPLSTSTPLPPDLPFAPQLRNAHLKYYRSMDQDDVLCLSRISAGSAEHTEDTMCQETQPMTESKENQPPSSNYNASTRRPAAVPFNFKTRLCMTYAQDRHCEMGDRCKFAHGVNELRQVDLPSRPSNTKYKTRLCKNFAQAAATGDNGFCPYGLRCEFIHPNDKEFVTLPNHIRRAVAACTGVVGGDCGDVTPEELAPPPMVRSAVKAAVVPKVLLQNKFGGSMMSLNTMGRAEDRSIENTRFGRTLQPVVGKPSKFSRRSSMSSAISNPNLGRRWASTEKVNS